jgi:hypothetical protein
MERKLGLVLLGALAVLLVGTPLAKTVLELVPPDIRGYEVVLVSTLLYSFVKTAVFLAAVALLVKLVLERKFRWVGAYLAGIAGLAIFSRYAYAYTTDSAWQTAFYFFDHFLPGNAFLGVGGPIYVVNFVYSLAAFLAWTLIFRGAGAPRA